MQAQHFLIRFVAVSLTAQTVLCGISPSPVRAQDAAAAEQSTSKGDKPSGGSDFLDMDIEQLRKTSVAAPSFDVEVTSVTKHESTVGRSPAAIYVLTNEMIRRSGYTTIPDLLRMVPGVQVSQINSHTWAVAVRGFNGQFSNKLLVLIDGRSVYNEVTSGVYWDTQDLIFDDIERIEVIRGPGATLWGVNAVNGVINIITKKAQDTQGLYINAGGGSHDRLIDGVRVGGDNGNDLYWRMYGKHFERGANYNPDGSSDDAWRVGRGGFRLDWEMDRHKRDTLTVEGDYYGGLEGQQITYSEPIPPYGPSVLQKTHVAGANVLARYTHIINDSSDWRLQTYFDRTLRKYTIADGTLINTQQVNTFDVDFQHRFPLGNNHSVTWGTNYRLYHDYLPGGFMLSYDPMQRTMDIFNMFVQDEITLKEDLLNATVGCKFSNEFFTGFQYQPTARLIWTPDERHAVWAAVSRAVRTPSRDEENFTNNVYIGAFPVPTFIRATPADYIVAEDMMAYELGYRVQATDRFAWDIALFYNVYDNLNAFAFGAPYWESTYLVLPGSTYNIATGQTYGLEISGQWTISDRWRLSAWYAFLKMDTDPNTAAAAALTQGNSPQNQAYLQSSWDLGNYWRFDAALRYVDCLTGGGAPRYIEMDLRLAWKPNKHFEAALVGQNLLDSHHYEFSSEGLAFGLRSNEVPRSVYASATWLY